ncbi:MAG: CocE/NonD family hydrolase [Thermoguttaceae bacterium]|nr:CocE/NonD family hydrolase [Thermoguttaceae bacterium]
MQFHPISHSKRLAMLSMLGVLLLMLVPAFGREALYDVATETDVMVPMRDGVRLATDVYRPAKDGKPIDGKLPAIVTRLPYGKGGHKGIGTYYAARGYVFVVQDTRGRFNSEGVWHMLTDDGPDGYDTAEWIVAQPWSDGKFGMMGTSYFGGTQHAMAMVKAPGLATVIPVDAMSNMGYQSMRNAGAFEMRFWNWTLRDAARGSRHARDPGTAGVLKEMYDNRKAYLANLPLRHGTTPLKFAPEYEEWLVEAMWQGGNTEFWKQNSIIDYPELYKDIPVYLVGGWYDSWGGNTTANYMALSEAIEGPVYLIMGPWVHNAQSGSAHGQVSFGGEAGIRDHLGWRLQWFDHWLKGAENAVGREAPFATPVRIFVMGTGDGRKTGDGKLNHGGYWRDEQEWPLARTQYTEYHLQPGGGLAASTPPAGDASTSFQFDPRDPVPTIGGCISSGEGILLAGAWDQRGGPHVWNFPDPIPLSARNDVLVFQTEPLEEDIEVTGEISVKLWISSSAPDTDFTAKLVDVYPPSEDFPGGFDLLIGDGILRTRFRESLTEEKLMEPGEVYPVTIKLYPASNVFKKGHRIRVDISSSNFPRFDLNPNTGEPLNDNRRVETAVNTVYHDRERPSHILLPVIPQEN